MSANSDFHALLEYIKPKRLRDSTRGEQNILVETESDKGRIINSAAFRRLQQKAQVFPLDTNAAVRTRLTHSIEVSQIGRYLAQKVIEGCEANDSDYANLASIANTIESACLLHDIGNPPFGHFGEAAIKEWAKIENRSEDICEYDGNPQGFRLISFLNGDDSHGMNLTCTLLLSTIKYPWDPEKKPKDSRKIGLFSSDYPVYEQACEKIGWYPGKAFPLAMLMEAADDIAYSMSDLEDGLEKGIISIDDLRKEFGTDLIPEDNGSPVSPFILFKTRVITNTVSEASQIFVENLGDILNGNRIELVGKEQPSGKLVDKVKTFARKKIYSDPSAERIELAGRSVIKGLLTHFDALLDKNVSEENFLYLIDEEVQELKHKDLDYEIRLARKLPKRYRQHYKDIKRGSDERRREHLIVDNISGMTDDRCLST